jgi:hypothetical protein
MNKIVSRTCPEAKFLQEGLLNGIVFRFFTIPGEEGTTIFPEKDCPYGEIHIGIEQEWKDVLGTILHELMEGCLILLEATFQKDTSVSNDRSTRYFMYDHALHAELAARIGEALKDIYDAYKEAWDKTTAKRYTKLKKTLDASLEIMQPKRKRKLTMPPS